MALMKLNIVLAESALELVPDQVKRHPAVTKDATRRGKDSTGILLDRSIHHAAMERLEEDYKRGRPDLVHVTLLSITGSPLFLDGMVKLYVHTFDDVVVEIAAGTRIPKNYLRFRNLMEKHLSERVDTDLLKVYDQPIDALIRKRIRPDLVIGLSIQGGPKKPEEVARKLAEARNPALLIGGFPHGHFGEKTIRLLDDIIRIHEKSLDAHVVAARIVYEVEKANETSSR
jgi:rRNA small subunit pseudouridine methyltransferase Nep1